MRTVYVDVLFIVNCLIDLILLLCLSRLLHLGTKPLRLLLAALFGGVTSLTALLPRLSPLLNIPLDLLGAAALVFIAFGKTDIKHFAVRTAALFSVSFSFCGVMLFVCNAFHFQGAQVYNDVVYFNISPIVLIILTLLCYYTLVLLKRFTQGAVGKHVCTVTLQSGGKTASFSAIVDTGCQVREPFSGEYVIVADKSCLNDIQFSDTAKRVIPFDSLGGSGMLEGMKAEAVAIDGKEVGCQLYIGVCEGVLKGSVKAIVPYAVMQSTDIGR